MRVSTVAAISLCLLTIPGAGEAQAVSIFNGRDLEGWRIHGTERWYVEDGELVCESGPDERYGYLATEKVYKDFDLTLEFRQEADGNSGVFFRSSIEGTRIEGWQAEVAPPGKYENGALRCGSPFRVDGVIEPLLAQSSYFVVGLVLLVRVILTKRVV